MSDTTGYSAKDIFKLSQSLADDPELRKKVEAEIQAEMADGESFYIDSYGYCHTYTPVLRSKVADGRVEIITNDVFKG
jgi:phosphoenolpyruvate-protein kinase (PTS system EI component)